MGHAQQWLRRFKDLITVLHFLGGWTYLDQEPDRGWNVELYGLLHSRRTPSEAMNLAIAHIGRFP